MVSPSCSRNGVPAIGKALVSWPPMAMPAPMGEPAADVARPRPQGAPAAASPDSAQKPGSSQPASSSSSSSSASSTATATATAPRNPQRDDSPRATQLLPLPHPHTPPCPRSLQKVFKAVRAALRAAGYDLARVAVRTADELRSDPCAPSVVRIAMAVEPAESPGTEVAVATDCTLRPRQGDPHAPRHPRLFEILRLLAIACSSLEYGWLIITEVAVVERLQPCPPSETPAVLPRQANILRLIVHGNMVKCWTPVTRALADLVRDDTQRPMARPTIKAELDLVSDAVGLDHGTRLAEDMDLRNETEHRASAASLSELLRSPSERKSRKRKAVASPGGCVQMRSQEAPLGETRTLMNHDPYPTGDPHAPSRHSTDSDAVLSSSRRTAVVLKRPRDGNLDSSANKNAEIQLDTIPDARLSNPRRSNRKR